jgi:hypothetical protein
MEVLEHPDPVEAQERLVKTVLPEHLAAQVHLEPEEVAAAQELAVLADHQVLRDLAAVAVLAAKQDQAEHRV